LLLAAPLFAATERPEIISPCSSPSISPSDTLAVEGDVVVFVLNTGGFRPCAYSIFTTTPDVLSVGTPFQDANGYTYLNVVALQPGEGILMMTSSFFGATTTRQVSAVHVDTCAAGSHGLALRPEYGGVARSEVDISADVTGTFAGGLRWYVNGQFIFDGPTLKYTPPANGVYQLELRGESACGAVTARSELVVGGRGRGVRRR